MVAIADPLRGEEREKGRGVEWVDAIVRLKSSLSSIIVIYGRGWKRWHSGACDAPGRAAVRVGKDVGVVGHRELPGPQGLRSTRHRSEHQFRAGQVVLQWSSLHLCLWRYKSHPGFCAAGALQHRHRSQSRPRRY